MNQREAKIASLKVIHALIYQEINLPTTLTNGEDAEIGIDSKADQKRVEDTLYWMMRDIGKRIKRLEGK